MSSLRISNFRRLGRPLLIGHRGCRESLPENSLAAIARAAELGADGVEIDVRLCASGEIVVAHDPDLERVTQGMDRRAIAALPHRELARISIGGDQTVPLLEEVLVLCASRGLCLNVEMKRDVPDRAALTANVARLLRGVDGTLMAFVSSFDPLMLAHFRCLAPSLPVAMLLHQRSRAPARYAPPPVFGVHAVHVERALVTAARVRRWHRRGMRVHVWTVNEPAEYATLTAWGVDGIITDVPGRLLDGPIPAGGASPGPLREDRR